MAPRRRPRKIKGLRRMDAALDAMKSYGFSEELISSTIKELLDVYGSDGWPFIEEASYKVLLDNILEKVENEATEKGDGRGGDNTEASWSGSSSSALAPLGSNNNAMAIELQSNVPIDNTLQNMKAPVNAEQPTDGSECNDTNMDKDYRKKEISNAEGTDDENSHAVKKPESRNLSLHPQEKVNPPSIQRRRPCHGWISDSSDDEGEPDLVELPPGPLSLLAKRLSETNVGRSRKRRWDVRPEDMKIL